jgi:hypothetical protein
VHEAIANGKTTCKFNPDNLEYTLFCQKYVRSHNNFITRHTVNLEFLDILREEYPDCTVDYLETKDIIPANFIGDIITPEKSQYSFLIDKMTAAVLHIPFVKKGGAYFDNINNSDESNTLVTIRPNQLSEEYDSIPTTMTVKDYKKYLRQA